MPPVSRRSVLATITGGVASGTSGCLRRFRTVAGRERSEQVTLSIRTTPADEDPIAVRLARYLAVRLDRVGIDAEVMPMTEAELLRSVLIEHDFELYVTRHPRRTNPDFLWSSLHSRFGNEPGWQNPFGYTNLQVDDLLDEQRRTTGRDRREALAELQREIARTQPYTVIAFPDTIRAVRADGAATDLGTAFDTALEYLALERPAEWTEETLRVATTDERPTENRNPLAVAFHDRDVFAELLYDPLFRHDGEQFMPWLAMSLSWQETGHDGPVATVELRPGATWHDGRPLTATDVAFTYRFLADTALDAEANIPAPRFRGRSALIERIEALDERTLRVAFVESNRTVAARAFTVPVLPAHKWRERADPTAIAGIDTSDTTEALVRPNRKPVGSGPLRFERADPDERLVLERVDEHFSRSDELGERLDGGFAFEQLHAIVVPSGRTAIELLGESEAEATATSLAPGDVPHIGRTGGVGLAITPSEEFYHLGFNARGIPLDNPRFRRAVARLLDKAHLVADVFDGYATPAASPLARKDALAPSLAWEGSDPELPFPGDRGTLDVPRARQAFRDAGYRYGENDALLARSRE